MELFNLANNALFPIRKMFHNYTGDDLAYAKQAMLDAQAEWEERKKAYDQSIAKGHSRYARTHRKPEMDTAWANYQKAKQFYDDIVASIDSVSNLDYMNAQRDYQSAQLDGAATGTSSTDLSSYIYLALALLGIAYFWQS